MFPIKTWELKDGDSEITWKLKQDEGNQVVKMGEWPTVSGSVSKLLIMKSDFVLFGLGFKDYITLPLWCLVIGVRSARSGTAKEIWSLSNADFGGNTNSFVYKLQIHGMACCWLASSLKVASHNLTNRIFYVAASRGYLKSLFSSSLMFSPETPYLGICGQPLGPRNSIWQPPSSSTVLGNYKIDKSK